MCVAMLLEFQAFTWETRGRHHVKNDASSRVQRSSYLITGYGRAEDGRSVRLTVLDYRPSVYVRTTDEETVRRTLKKGRYAKGWGGHREQIPYDPQWLVKMERVERNLLYGFRNGERTAMLKLTCANPDVMRQMITALADGGLRTCNGDLRNFDPLHTFFWVHNIKPCGWLSVTYARADMVIYEDDEISHPGLSRGFCDIDLVVELSALTPLLDKTEVAPMKVMSFDIEQNGIPQLAEGQVANEVVPEDDDEDEQEEEEEKFRFPDSTLPECEISCICLRAFRHGQERFTLHCFTYKAVYEEEIRAKVGASDIVVHQGRDERDMLSLFVDHLQSEQYDVGLGWNTLAFDWSAIHTRCAMHGVSLRRVGKRELWKEPELRVQKSTTQSRGNTEIKMFEIPGMFEHDLLRIWREDHKERSYGLEAVSSAHLGEHKIPMDPNHITSLAKSADPMGLTEVTIYCAQDTKLPYELAKKYRKLLNLLMFCNVAQILPNEYIQRGSNVRTMSLVGARLERMDVVVEDVEHAFNTHWKKYQGAWVLDPIRGYHKKPISTHDFAGLYPACINAFFIDYMRWVVIGGPYDNLPGVEYKDVEWVDKAWDDKNKRYNYERVHQRYVIGEGFPSLMPTLMTELRTERKAAKKRVKDYKKLAKEHVGTPLGEENELLMGIWDANQLAIKLLMNAGYGFLGTPLSPLPHRGLAMCVTRYGRFMLEQAQRYTLARYGRFDDVEVAPDDRTDEDVHRVAQGRSLEALRDDAKGLVIVYGDSVTGDTPLLLKLPTGAIGVTTFAQIVQDDAWTAYDNFKPGDLDRTHKQQALVPGVLVWACDRWTPVVRVIRHKTHKRIVRVLTHTGAVDCTEDHSLLTPEGRPIKPGDCAVGTPLLHGLPPLAEFATLPVSQLAVERAFLMGCFMGDGSCGVYDCPSGAKASWYIGKNNIPLLERCGRAVEAHEGLGSKILDTVQSSKTPRLVPVGGYGAIKTLALEYRSLFYDASGRKFIPPYVLNASEEARRAFLSGLYATDGDKGGCTRLDQRGQVGCQGLVVLLHSLGHTVSINTRADNPDIFRMTWFPLEGGKHTSRRPLTSVKKIYPLRDTAEGEFVYDIETAEGYFNAGVGAMTVKNTDSIMVKWDLSEDLNTKLDGDEAEQNEVLRWVFGKAEEACSGASKYINRHFCHDVVWEGDAIKSCSMDLEFEKVFYPSDFKQRKRYLYRKLVEPIVSTGCVQAQGMAMVRRDISKISRDLLWDCANAYMTRQHETLKQLLTTTFGRLVEMAQCIGDPEQIPLEELEVTKQLAVEYKTKSLPSHKVVADKCSAPRRGENPSPGDRIGYVQIIDHHDKKKTECVDSIKWIRKEKLPVDVTQIAKDMLDVLQQVVPESSGIVVSDVVKHLMQSIDAHQQPHFANRIQELTGNRGLAHCGFEYAVDVKRKSADHAVSDANKKRRATKRKDEQTRPADGQLRALFGKKG